MSQRDGAAGDEAHIIWIIVHTPCVHRFVIQCENCVPVLNSFRLALEWDRLAEMDNTHSGIEEDIWTYSRFTFHWSSFLFVCLDVFVFHWRHSFHLSDWIGHFHSFLTIRVVFWIAYNDCANQNAFYFMCQRYLCLVEQSKWIAILEFRSNHEKQQRNNQHQQQWPANRFWRLSKANLCTWGTEC